MNVLCLCQFQNVCDSSDLMVYFEQLRIILDVTEPLSIIINLTIIIFIFCASFIYDVTQSHIMSTILIVTDLIVSDSICDVISRQIVTALHRSFYCYLLKQIHNE